MIRKRFPHYWSFVREFQRSVVDSRHEVPLLRSLECEGRQKSQRRGYDCTAYMDYMDLDVSLIHYRASVFYLMSFNKLLNKQLRHRWFRTAWRSCVTAMYYSGYGLSQWETTLLCNVVSHWLSPYPDWLLWWRRLVDIFEEYHRIVAFYESTEALKGHRVLWKIEICYLIRMT